MERAVESSMPMTAYVVPAPRVTDAVGQTLRRIFAPLPGVPDLDQLLRRLDTLP